MLTAPDNIRSAVFAGCNELSQTFARQIESSPDVAIKVHGYFDDRNKDRLEFEDSDRLLGGLSDLAEYVN